MPDGFSVVAIIPAHNEQDQIKSTIDSLCGQSRPPNKVVIVADNCTDDTIPIVQQLMQAYPALELFETVGNKAKKAGALNQALAQLQPSQWDYLLQMDADTELDSRLVEEALKEFQREPMLGGVGSRCFLKQVEPSTNWWEKLLWRFQNLEYGFADSTRVQRGGSVKVLAGAVCMYRMEVLQQVVQKNLKEFGRIVAWREDSLVEDYELTLDVQRLGYKTEAGMRMFSYTDAPVKVWQGGGLKDQRFRWYGGTAATIRRRKLASEIRGEVLVQIFYLTMILARVFLAFFWVGVLLLVPLSNIQLEWWMMVMPLATLANYVRRIQFVPNLDVTQWLLVVTLVPLEIYVTWDQILTLCSYGKNFIKPSTAW